MIEFRNVAWGRSFKLTPRTEGKGRQAPEGTLPNTSASWRRSVCSMSIIFSSLLRSIVLPTTRRVLSGTGTVLSGTRAVLSGIGEVLPGTRAVLPGIGAVVPSTGAALSGTGAVVPSTGAVLSGTGAVVSGIRAVLSGIGAEFPSSRTVLSGAEAGPGRGVTSQESGVSLLVL
jgi:hypothetical protein